jgi:hypothetical protein
MPMNVREVTFNKQIKCNTDVEVIWGFNRDTICFLFNDRAYCFYPLTKKSKNKLPKRIDTSLKGVDLPNNRHFIVQNHLDEIYLIRIIIPKNGKILIFVINIIHGYPSYTFGFHCSECIY